MGKRIVYCDQCGKSLLEDEFAKGKASVVDDRPYCASCRPPSAPKVSAPPLPIKPVTARIAVTPSTARRTAAPRPAWTANRTVVVGSAVGGLVLILVILVLASGERPERAPAEPLPAAPPPKPSPSPSVPAPPPKPGPSSKKEEAERIEREMREQRDREQARQLDAFLAQIRSLIEEDPKLTRRAEIDGMIASALRTAGARGSEVEKLQSEYRKRVDQATRRLTLMGHWKLDEGSGATASDSSGNGHTGTLQKGPVWVPGKFGGALSFSGVEDAVVVEEIEGLSPHAGPKGELTVSAWIKLDALPPETGQKRRPILAKGQSGAWEYALYVEANGRFEFLVWQPGGSNYASVVGGLVTLGQWQHVAGALKKGQFAALYLDGAPLNRLTSFAGDTAAGPSPLYIGRRIDGHSIKGAVDDVRIYSRALSDAEVQALFDGREP